MGTRGSYGFRLDEKDYLTYNHFDSYPGGLGEEIVSEITSLMEDYKLLELEDMVRDLTMVDREEEATEEDIEILNEYADTNVSSGDKTEWYVLLRDMQGDLRAHLETGYMIDNEDFIYNSLFCEWAYIINLDSWELEVYKGFQKEEHDRGRYSDGEKDGDYYPCALVATFELVKLDEYDYPFMAELPEIIGV